MNTVAVGNVNEAGKKLIEARVHFSRGEHTEAAALVKQARALLYEESKWDFDKDQPIVRFYDFVIELDSDLLKLDKIDLSVPAAMFYFGKSHFEFFSKVHAA
jgi:hypothetical protein